MPKLKFNFPIVMLPLVFVANAVLSAVEGDWAVFVEDGNARACWAVSDTVDGVDTPLYLTRYKRTRGTRFYVSFGSKPGTTSDLIFVAGAKAYALKTSVQAGVFHAWLLNSVATESVVRSIAPSEAEGRPTIHIVSRSDSKKALAAIPTSGFSHAMNVLRSQCR